VMGDNRRESRDSRVFGPVPVTELRGRVVSVLWPPRRWGGVS
jgi:signal peptidase I